MKKTCLEDVIERYNYNVQKIRFLAAVLVIISHAYPIACLEKDPLAFISKGSISLGGLSVYIFFFISGLYASRTYVGGG